MKPNIEFFILFFLTQFLNYRPKKRVQFELFLVLDNYFLF